MSCELQLISHVEHVLVSVGVCCQLLDGLLWAPLVLKLSCQWHACQGLSYAARLHA